MSHKPSFDLEIKSYKEQQNAAVSLIQIVSNLWYNQAIELVFFRNQLIDVKSSSILHLVKESVLLTDEPLHIFDILQVAGVLENLPYLLHVSISENLPYRSRNRQLTTTICLVLLKMN